MFPNIVTEHYFLFAYFLTNAKVLLSVSAISESIRNNEPFSVVLFFA